MIARRKHGRRVRVPRVVRDALLKDQQGICYICGNRIDVEDAQSDHIITWAGGGGSGLENLRAVCGDCNRRRGVRFL